MKTYTQQVADLKTTRAAKADEVSDESAKELLHHNDVKVTRRVYRRKVPVSTPLPSAIGGREKA